MRMTDNEMRVFLQQIADKMNTNFHIDMANSFADALKAMAENANAVLKSINLDALRCTLLMISDVLSSLPKGVKETAFFQKVDKFAKDDKHSLHNGIVSYSEEDLKTVYEVLADFMDALVVMKKWIPVKDDNEPTGQENLQ